jgi:hypothetical protein
VAKTHARRSTNGWPGSDNAFGLSHTGNRWTPAPDIRAVERRIYWLGAVVAIASAFFIAFPPCWKTGLQIALLAAVVP